MTVIDHLDELRTRLIWCALAFVAATVAGWFLTVPLVTLATQSVKTVVFMAPEEPFMVRLRLAAVTGFFLALPVILYHLYRFTGPALSKDERRVVLLVMPGAVVAFAVGALFAYWTVVPTSIKMLLGFATPTMQPMLSVDRYVSFVLALVLVMGLVFEIPIALIVLARFGIVSAKQLKEQWRVAVVSIFVLAAIVTPSQDMFTQTIVAIPMLGLYGLSILGAQWVGRPSHRAAEGGD